MSDAPTGTAPLVARPPGLEASAARRVAAEQFGKRGTVTELGGERDQNFRIDTDTGTFVLKISNPADGPGVIDLQTEALAHVASTDPDLPVMRVVPTTDGSPWTTIENDSGEPIVVRMFTHVPGRSPAAADLDRDALYNYGTVVARAGQALRGFFHPEARYDILWDLRHTPELRSLLDSVADEGRRDLAERVLDRFDERVAPIFDSLRAQVIHNDLTLDNVLFDGDRVGGIVDFGDLTYTALVCDLAIALASVMYRRDDPVDAAEAVVRGYVGVTPLEDEEAALLADLVMARLAAWGVIVAWRQAEHPDKTDHTATGVDNGWALLRSLEDIGPDVLRRRLRTAALARSIPYDRRETDDLLARRRRVLGSSPLSYDEPVHFVAGRGAWLFDRSGRRYLDAYNNVQVVGHGNPDVAAAIGSQARTLATNTRYLHESPVALGERLLATLPDELDRVLFVNSGSEANDLAYRLATAATGRSGALVTTNAYHGITEATVALSPEVWSAGQEPDHVETVPPPAETEPTGAPTSSDPIVATEDALTALERQGHGAAAFVFDSLFTSDGIHHPDGEQLAAMADRVRDAGGLVVADEVQAGHGRTGSNLWGFQATDVVPDVVTMGKPMGNGHPVAAVVTRSDVAEPLMDDPGVFSTFGGNPVSCTAALAVLDVIEDRNLLDNAATVGAYLETHLTEFAGTYDLVGEVRRSGLMIGVELLTDHETETAASDATAAVVEELRQRRILIGSTGRAGDVLKIRPPLVFDRNHADRLLEALDAALESVEHQYAADG